MHDRRTKHDGDNPEIEPGEYVKLTITDTGKGIERDVLERVFEPFFSTKPIGQGTGLGLSQVYGFVKQTGGHVQIHSEPGQGHDRRTLSAARRAGRHRRMLAPEPIEDSVRAPRKNGHAYWWSKTIPTSAPIPAEILRELGFFVREAANAQTALDMLRSDSGIDLLFSDIGLPGMTGPELVREALKLRPELKILLTTGYAQDKTIDHARSEPGVLLIAKALRTRGSCPEDQEPAPAIIAAKPLRPHEPSPLRERRVRRSIAPGHACARSIDAPRC